MVWLAAGNFKTHQKFIWETGNFSVGAASELRIFGGPGYVPDLRMDHNQFDNKQLRKRVSGFHWHSDLNRVAEL